MVRRDLLKYRWEYEDGIISLWDKRRDVVFTLPVTYADSLMRALITFKNAYRVDQFNKGQDYIKKLKDTNADLKIQIKKDKMQLKEKL